GTQPQAVNSRLAVRQSHHRTSSGRAGDDSSWASPSDRGSSPRVSKGVEPQSGAMFIARDAQNDPQLRRSEMFSSSETNVALLRSAGNNSGRPFYKYDIPTGLRQNHVQRNRTTRPANHAKGRRAKEP